MAQLAPSGTKRKTPKRLMPAMRVRSLRVYLSAVLVAFDASCTRTLPTTPAIGHPFAPIMCMEVSVRLVVIAYMRTDQTSSALQQRINVLTVTSVNSALII